MRTFEGTNILFFVGVRYLKASFAVLYGGTGGNKHLWSNNFRHVKLKIIHNVSLSQILRQIQVGEGRLRKKQVVPLPSPISKRMSVCL